MCNFLLCCLLWVWSRSYFSVFSVFVCLCYELWLFFRAYCFACRWLCFVYFFVCASARFVCVLLSFAIDLAVFSHAACFVALSRAVKLVNVFLIFLSFLRFISAQTMNICCQVGDSASFICWRVVYICMPLPLTWALRTTAALQGTRGRIHISRCALKQLVFFFFNVYPLKCICKIMMIKRDVSCFKDSISLVYLFASVAASASKSLESGLCFGLMRSV